MLSVSNLISISGHEMAVFRNVCPLNRNNVEPEDICLGELVRNLNTPGTKACSNVKNIGRIGTNRRKNIFAEEFAEPNLQIAKAFLFGFVIV